VHVDAAVFFPSVPRGIVGAATKSWTPWVNKCFLPQIYIYIDLGGYGPGRMICTRAHVPRIRPIYRDQGAQPPRIIILPPIHMRRNSVGGRSHTHTSRWSGGGGAAPPGFGARGGPITIFGPRVCITFHSGPWYINLGTQIYLHR
jgi:hypothetical protein